MTYKNIGDILPVAIENACRQSLSAVFNSVSSNRVCTDYIAVYQPDWNSTDNSNFLKNAQLDGILCFIAKDAVDARKNDGFKPAKIEFNLHGTLLQEHGITASNPDGSCDPRLQEVLAFARQWRKDQKENFDEPRLLHVGFPCGRALWLSGPRNVLIPVDSFDTKVGDLIALADDNYLTDVRSKHKAQQDKNKFCSPEAGE